MKAISLATGPTAQPKPAPLLIGNAPNKAGVRIRYPVAGAFGEAPCGECARGMPEWTGGLNAMPCR
eukprot:4291300-Pyramimonas_sp.AAC.1